MHMAALLDEALLIGFEVEIEMRERVVLDVARAVAQRVEFGQPVGDLAPPRDEIDLDETQAHSADRDRQAPPWHSP